MPPARTARISDRQWDEIETRIKQLVHQHVPIRCKDGTRITIPEIIQRESNIIITVSQLEAKLKSWNVAKNLKLREWKAVMPWLDELESKGSEYQLLLAGKEIKKSAIHRARRSLQSNKSADAPHETGAAVIEPRQISIKIRENDKWAPFKQITTALSVACPEEWVAQDDDIVHEGLGEDMRLSRNSEQPAPSTSSQYGQLVLRSANTDRRTKSTAPELGCTPVESFQRALEAPLEQGVTGFDFICFDQPFVVDHDLLSMGLGSPAPGLLDLCFNTPSSGQGSFNLQMDQERISAASQQPSDATPAAAGAVSKLGSVSEFLWSNHQSERSYDLLNHMLQHAADAQKSLSDDDELSIPPLPQVEMLFERLICLLPGEETEKLFSHGPEDANPESTIRMALVHSIINNFAGTDDIPVASVLWALKSNVRLRAELFKRLAESSAALAKTVADNLFRASVEARDVESAKLIIEAGKGRSFAIDLEHTVRNFNGQDFTPLQIAVRLWDHDMIQMLLDLGVDPNKPPPWQKNAAWDPIFLAVNVMRLRKRNSLALRLTALTLLKYGATTSMLSIDGFLDLDEEPHEMLEPGFLLPLFQGLPMTAHRKCFAIPEGLHPRNRGVSISHRLSILASNSEQTAVFRLLLDRCIKTQCGRCTITFAEACVKTMECAARSGNLELCELLLQNGIPVTIGVLCAAIQGQKRAMIDFCLQHGSVAITPAVRICDLSTTHYTRGTQAVPTTPLAEAVCARNIQLARICEGLGAWSLVGEFEEHFVAVVFAAASVGDLDSLARALKAWDAEFGSLLRLPLIQAIKTHQTEAALMLLDAGAGAGGSRFNSPLETALLSRNMELVEAMLESDANVFLCAMEEAGKWGDVSIIKKLTFMGGDLDRGKRTTVLVEAVKREDRHLVNFLLASGASPNACAEGSLSPLRQAIRMRSEEMVDILLSRGADPADQYAFTDAIKPPGNPCLDRLLAEFRKRHPQGLPGFGTDTLIEVIRTNEMHSLRLLLSAGFDASCFGRTRLTPLGFAIQQSANIEAVVQLLDAGVDFNRIALMSNATFIREEYDEVLSKQVRQEWPLEPALLVAVKAGKGAIVDLLLEKGADVNQPARLGVKRTPLQAACEVGSWKMVNLLLQRGADVSAAPVRSGGGTALQFAAKGGYVRIVQLLLSRGASIHEAPSRVHGRSALEGAAENGRLSVLGLLWTAAQSASCGFPDEVILRAIDYAKKKGHKGCADYLAWLWAMQSARARGISEEVYDFGLFV